MEKYPLKIAIIGGGLSSLSFLHSLSSSFLTSPPSSISPPYLQLFERSEVLGGRAATRRRGKYEFDNGANYFNADDEKIRKLIFESLPKEGLIEIEKWIFPFDKNNSIDFDREKVVYHLSS